MVGLESPTVQSGPEVIYVFELFIICSLGKSNPN